WWSYLDMQSLHQFDSDVLWQPIARRGPLPINYDARTTKVETREHDGAFPTPPSSTLSQHERPLSHRRRLHQSTLRRQSIGRLPRCARDLCRPYATDRARVQLFGDDVRAPA